MGNVGLSVAVVKVVMEKLLVNRVLPRIKALETQMPNLGFAETEISFPNEPFDIDEGKIWLRCSTVFNADQPPASVNEFYHYRREGIFSVEIFQPLNIGNLPAKCIYGEIRKTFQSFVGNDDTLTVTGVGNQVVGVDSEKFWREDAIITFNYEELRDRNPNNTLTGL